MDVSVLDKIRYKGIAVPEKGAATIHHPQPQKGKTVKAFLDPECHCPNKYKFDINCFAINCSGACPPSLTRFKDVKYSEWLCSIKLPFQAKCVFPNFEDALRALAEAQKLLLLLISRFAGSLNSGKTRKWLRQVASCSQYLLCQETSHVHHKSLLSIRSCSLDEGNVLVDKTDCKWEEEQKLNTAQYSLTESLISLKIHQGIHYWEGNFSITSLKGKKIIPSFLFFLVILL